MIDFIKDNILYLSIGLLIILIIILLLWFFKPKKKLAIPLIDTYQLRDALGGQDNIMTLSLEHQRLKVVVKDLKVVKSTLLKELNIPAFLKGRELTLLIKHNQKEIMSFLSERKKEV